MINLPYFHPHCNTWTGQIAETIDQEIEECPYCLSIRSLKYGFMATVWRWDLKLPDGWQFPNWESVKLLPIHVNQPVLRCSQCGEYIKVVPSFIQHGTTLTLPALIFVAFAYEFSDLTWRDLPRLFCAEHHQIAHSTLYKAVHGLGRFIQTDSEFRQLCQKHLPSIRRETIPRGIPPCPPPKSIYTHTVIREKCVRFLICTLWTHHPYFSKIVDRFVFSIEREFVHLNRTIPMLYKNDGRDGWEENTALDTA